MCVFLISPALIAEPLTSELIDTPVFYNLAPRPIKYRVSVPIPSCNGADKTRGMRIHLQAFIRRHGQNTGRVEQMANRYTEGKAEEYSGKRAWSTIGKQYPEGKAER